MTVRPLGDSDLEAVGRLSQLAFGYTSDTPPTDTRGLYGIDGPDGRLLALAKIRDYEQVWGGRPVPMGGIASVAVHPDGRGRGLSSELMRGLLPVMRDAGQSVSTLFPTAAGIYRPVGWEVVGSLDDTRIPLTELHLARADASVTVRTAGPADVPAIRELYVEQWRSGELTREGPEFPGGAEAVLEHDVVAVAESSDGHLQGYLSYARGSGYRGSELRVFECLTRTPAAATALLRSLASWSSVAATVRWRGPTDELALQLPRAVPAPFERQPWMLRINDAPAAIAARGFPAEVAADVGFRLHDPDVPEHSRGWRLRVENGEGTLAETTEDAPVLHVRGLALLYAGVTDSAGLVRAGLLDRDIPGLATPFAGPAPRILDYF